jgi:hypothetical protein
MKGPLLTIPVYSSEQSAVVQRSGYLKDLYSEGVAYIEASDNLKPEGFFIKNGFDLDFYLGRMVLAWQGNLRVPAPFRPRKRIPVKILDNLAQMDPLSRFETINGLREAGILPRLKKLSPGTQPEELDWSAVPGLCFKTKI